MRCIRLYLFLCRLLIAYKFIVFKVAFLTSAVGKCQFSLSRPIALIEFSFIAGTIGIIADTLSLRKTMGADFTNINAAVIVGQRANTKGVTFPKFAF